MAGCKDWTGRNGDGMLASAVEKKVAPIHWDRRNVACNKTPQNSLPTILHKVRSQRCVCMMTQMISRQLSGVVVMRTAAFIEESR